MAEQLGNHKKLTFDKDIISSLPDNIIETILAHLSLKGAISTSLLSRDWRYKWRYMPNLIFDPKSFPRRKMELPTSYKNKIVGQVNHAFLLHKGDIRKFKFSIMVKISSELYVWLDHLVDARVQQLTLHLSSTLHMTYLIPFSLFHCEMLVTLNLRQCKIKLPCSFNGFKSLKIMFLRSVEFIDDDAIETLIQLCPLLEHLLIKECDGCTVLRIHAPNLRSLSIHGLFSYLNLNGTKMVTFASISISILSNHCDLTNVVSNLANVEDLRLLGNTLKCLVNGDTSPKLDEIKLNMLKKLHLDFRLHCLKENIAVSGILRSSEALEYLYTNCFVTGHEEPLSTAMMCWEVHESISFKLNQLKVFNMKGVYGTKCEMMLIEFVLGNAPLLEKINLTPHRVVDRHNKRNPSMNPEFLQHLLSSRRASRATINFL